MILTTQGQLRDAKREPGLQFRCGDCGEVKDVQTEGGTGYAYYKKGDDEKPICYACCGKRDAAQMVREGKATLYLDREKREVGNWPGTLKFKLTALAVTRHSVFGRVKDVASVEFVGADGKKWYGRHYGGDHQLINVYRRKGK